MKYILNECSNITKKYMLNESPVINKQTILTEASILLEMKADAPGMAEKEIQAVQSTINNLYAFLNSDTLKNFTKISTRKASEKNAKDVVNEISKKLINLVKDGTETVKITASIVAKYVLEVLKSANNNKETPQVKQVIKELHLGNNDNMSVVNAIKNHTVESLSDLIMSAVPEGSVISNDNVTETDITNALNKVDMEAVKVAISDITTTVEKSKEFVAKIFNRSFFGLNLDKDNWAAITKSSYDFKSPYESFSIVNFINQLKGLATTNDRGESGLIGKLKESANGIYKLFTIKDGQKVINIVDFDTSISKDQLNQIVTKLNELKYNYKESLRKLEESELNIKELLVKYHLWDEAGNSDSKVIEKHKLNIPYLKKSSFVYDEQDVHILDEIVNLNNHIKTNGDTLEKNIGEYAIICSIIEKDKYEWTDNTSDDITLKWKIIEETSSTEQPKDEKLWFWDEVFTNIKKGINKSYHVTDKDGKDLLVSFSPTTNNDSGKAALDTLKSTEIFWKTFGEHYRDYDSVGEHHSIALPAGLNSFPGVNWQANSEFSSKIYELYEPLDKEALVFESVYAIKNPFFTYLWLIMNMFKNKDSISKLKYSVINNMVADKIIGVEDDKNDLIGNGYLGMANIIFCEDLFTKNVNDMIVYLKAQKICIDSEMPVKQFINTFYTDETKRTLVNTTWISNIVKKEKATVDDSTMREIKDTIRNTKDTKALAVAQVLVSGLSGDDIQKVLKKYNLYINVPADNAISFMETQKIKEAILDKYKLSAIQLDELVKILAIKSGLYKDKTKEEK